MIERLRVSAGMSELVDRSGVLEWVIRISDGDESIWGPAIGNFIKRLDRFLSIFPCVYQYIIRALVEQMNYFICSTPL